MSIYATWLSIEDQRQTAADFAAHGINYGVIGEDGPLDIETDLSPEDYDAPIVYEGSHVLPSDDARRGGSIDVAAIPDFIERDGRDDAQGTGLKDWLRLSVDSEDSIEQYEGKPYVQGGRAVVVLTRQQVERLRDTLTEWLEVEERG
jgi:hypothetical protein